MDAVAATGKTSKQTLYRAFPSKDDLFAAVVRDWVDLGHDALRPHTLALAETGEVSDGLLKIALVLQQGILSPGVLQMRALVAAQADAFPQVAADYLSRSWDRNIGLLSRSLATLDRRGLLTIPDPTLAAEQFLWLVVGSPLNRLTLAGATFLYSRRRLERIAHEAVTTFLSRYQPQSPIEVGRPTRLKPPRGSRIKPVSPQVL